MKTRSRLLHPGPQSHYWYYNGKYISKETLEVKTVVTDTLASAGNFWPPPRRLRHVDMGNGAFTAISYKWQGSGAASAFYRKLSSGVLDQRSCSGLLLPESPIVPVPWVPSNAYMDVMGTKGFNATIPTKPLQQAAVFAGELRQLPKISPTVLLVMKDRAWKYVQSWRAHVRKAPKYTQAVADEYINQQFGWLPFLKDIESLLTPRVKLMAKVHQLERDSGKKVRRRRTLANVTNSGPVSITIDGGYGYPLGLSQAQLATSQGRRIVVATTRENVWFSASFTYYLESKTKGLGVPRAVQMARMIHGLSINPETLWNLMPWSWLADYIGNVGGVLSNLSAFSKDNLVASHAYLMIRTEVTRSAALVGIGTRSGTLSCFSETTAICKRRVRGMPFGFGFTGPLTGKQTAILVALGLSNGLK